MSLYFHESLSKKLKTGIVAVVAVPALFLAGCSESDDQNSASQTEETAASESSVASESATTSAEESKDKKDKKVDGDLTEPGTTLKLGETATVMTEDYDGNLLTWELAVNEPVEKTVEEVHEAAGQEIGKPEDQIEKFICVPYTMTLKKVEQVGEEKPYSVEQPDINLTDDRGYKANKFLLFGGGEEIVCGIDAVDVMPTALEDVQIDRPYQYAALSYVTSEGGNPATAASFEYDIPSNSDLTPSDPISWR